MAPVAEHLHAATSTGRLEHLCTTLSLQTMAAAAPSSGGHSMYRRSGSTTIGDARICSQAEPVIDADEPHDG